MDGGRKPMNDRLAVNSFGRNIRKTPLHQQQQQQRSGTGGGNRQPPPQAQVYNINKNDFRTLVQQLTGTPPRDPSLVHQSPPMPTGTRLQRIRPPPLPSLARPDPAAPPSGSHAQFRPAIPNFPPPPGVPLSQPAAAGPTGSVPLAGSLESPISAFMRYLESATPTAPIPAQPGQTRHAPSAPPASADGPQSAATFPMCLRPPVTDQRSSLSSPASPFPLPSPSAFLNLLSPRSPSPFPLLSPSLLTTPDSRSSPLR